MSKASGTMTSTPVRADSDRADGTPRPGRLPTARTGVELAMAVAALAALTVAGMHWSLGAEPSAPAAPTAPAAPARSGPPAAYLPGGSVYEQQVPDVQPEPQHWALVTGPDGTVYKSQVPRAR